MKVRGKISNNSIKKALSHTFEEIEIPNIVISIEKCDYEKLRKSHDSIHELMYLAPFCVPSKVKVSWQSKSAFLTYHWDAFHSAHRSFIEALEGYYNVGYVLLRTTLELLIKGAFWECLAHKKFRDNANILCKPRKKKKTLVEWINDLIERESSVENDLEEISVAIFDKTAIIFEDSEFKKEFIYLPTFREIVEQLADWGIFDPIQNPVELAYDKIYSELSENVHVVPDKADIGRRLLLEMDLFEVDVIPKELGKYLEVLHKLIDVGIVIEINVLKDWIIQNGEVKSKLKERLTTIEDLELRYSAEKFKSLILGKGRAVKYVPTVGD